MYLRDRLQSSHDGAIRVSTVEKSPFNVALLCSFRYRCTNAFASASVPSAGTEGVRLAGGGAELAGGELTAEGLAARSADGLAVGVADPPHPTTNEASATHTPATTRRTAGSGYRSPRIGLASWIWNVVVEGGASYGSMGSPVMPRSGTSTQPSQCTFSVAVLGPVVLNCLET